MIKRTWANLALLAEKHRLALWILLVLLTAIILFFPVHLAEYEYHAIQSPYIFGDSLPLFAALYVSWIALLLLLLFSGREDSIWERAALVCIFGVVFLGFWGIISPNRWNDGLNNIRIVNYITEGGVLEYHHNIGYLSFPGLHVLGSSLCQITGLEDFDAVAVLTTVNAALLSALLYLLFLRTLKRSTVAAFAAIMVLQGSIMISACTYFYPGYFALTLLVAFLLLINKQEQALSLWGCHGLVVVILLIGVTVMHFSTSLCFFFILLGIYLVQKVMKREIVTLPAVALFFTIILAWQVFWLFGGFESLVGMIPEMLEDLSTTVNYAAEHDTHLIQVNLPGYSGHFSSSKLFGLQQI